MADDPDENLTEDELLALPQTVVAPHLSAIRSALLYHRQYDELNNELTGNTLNRRLMIFHGSDPESIRHRDDERSREEFERIVRERTDRLLAQIGERQIEIEKRRKEIEDNALRLRDGRRVYVDGDRYRDEAGRVLTGPDAVDAAEQHALHPNASTFVQKQENERQDEEMRKLKDKVMEKQVPGLAPEQAAQNLTGFEKEFTGQANKWAAQPPDYGTADYMADYAGPAGGEGKTSTTAFATAAKGYENDPREAIVETTHAETVEIKKAPQPFGQGAKSNV